MVYAVFILVGNQRTQIYVFNALEYVLFHLGIGLFKLFNKLLYLHPFGAVFFVIAAQAVVGKLAGAAYKVEPVAVPPPDYIAFANEIHRADELHTLEVGAVKLGHHSLNLRAVEHTHKYGFDYVVVVVTERNFVAAQILGKAVEMPPPHPCAEVARVSFNMIDRFEYIRLENMDRYAEIFCVVLDNFAVVGIVAGVHYEIFDLELEF